MEQHRILNMTISDYASHEFVYALGTVSSRGIAALLSASPYMRRLQAVHYFSDLQGILQTTYEQHVEGTSMFMKYYSKALAKLRANTFEGYMSSLIIPALRVYDSRMIASDGDDRAYKEALKNMLEYFDYIYRDYERRLEHVSQLPSIVGMLAAPPYRRPFGTAIKRSFMEELTRILWREVYNKKIERELTNESIGKDSGAGVREILDSLRGSLENFYFEVYGIEDPIGPRFVPRLSEALDELDYETIRASIPLAEHVRPSGSIAVLRHYKQGLRRFIERLYSTRITPYEYVTGLGERSGIPRHLLLSSAFMPAGFLLRYRTASTILALGYASLKILQETVETVDALLGDEGLTRLSREDLDKMLELLYDLLDAFLLVAEAVIVNHVTTIIILRELVEIVPENDESPNLYTSLLGASQVVILDSLSLAETHEERINILLESIKKFISTPGKPELPEDAARRCIERKKYCILVNEDTDKIEVEERKNAVLIKARLKKIRRIGEREATTPDYMIIPWTSTLDTYFKDEPVYCCLLEYRKGRSPTGEGPRRRCEGLCDMARRLVSLGLLSTLLEYPGTRLTPPIARTGHGDVSPFLSYFKVNLIQSDMIPSAYQLDLLNRLKKDIDVGMLVNPSNLNEVILNLENYSYMTLAILSAIYTFLFRDISILQERASILLRSKERINAEIVIAKKDGNKLRKLTRIVKTVSKLTYISWLYYSALSEEIDLLASRINEYTNRLDDLARPLTRKESINVENVEDELKVIVNKIYRAVKHAKEILLNYSKLLKYIFLHKLGEDPKKYTRHGLDKISIIVNVEGQQADKNGVTPTLFRSLVDHYIQTILLLPPTDKQDAPENEAAALIHGTIPAAEIYAKITMKDDWFQGRYNGIAYTLSTVLQNIKRDNLETLIMERLKKEEWFDPINVTIIFPVQGIVKPYFHLPEEAGAMPKIIDALPQKNLDKIYDQKRINRIINKETPVLDAKILKIMAVTKQAFYEYITKIGTKTTLHSILRDWTLPELIHYPGIKLLPDTTFWNIIASGTTKEQEYKRYSSHIIQTKIKQTHNFINVLYSIIIKIKQEQIKNKKTAGNKTIYEIQEILEENFINMIKKLLK